MLRRFCQSPADASNLLKNMASALSAKISFLMGSGELALFMLMFTSLVLSETAKFVNKKRNWSVGLYVLCSLVAFWSLPILYSAPFSCVRGTFCMH